MQLAGPWRTPAAGRGRRRAVCRTERRNALARAPDPHPRSRTLLRDRPHHLFECGETVSTDEVVAVRQRRLHTRDERRVTRRGPPRIDPHDPVRQPAQPAHGLGHLLRVVLGPPVGEHDDHRAAGQPAPSVVGDEPADALGQPGAAGPVRRRGTRPGQRLVGIPPRQLPGEPGQPGREDERLRPGAGDRALQQGQVDAGVGLHRARDVAQQHQPARLRPPVCAHQARRVPAACGGPPEPCAAGPAGRRAATSAGSAGCAAPGC